MNMHPDTLYRLAKEYEADRLRWVRSGTGAAKSRRRRSGRRLPTTWAESKFSEEAPDNLEAS